MKIRVHGEGAGGQKEPFTCPHTSILTNAQALLQNKVHIKTQLIPLPSFLLDLVTGGIIASLVHIIIYDRNSYLFQWNQYFSFSFISLVVHSEILACLIYHHRNKYILIYFYIVRLNIQFRTHGKGREKWKEMLGYEFLQKSI